MLLSFKNISKFGKYLYIPDLSVRASFVILKLEISKIFKQVQF